MPDLTYALNSNNRMVHIDRVTNGLKCGCRCPGCGAQLIAKNNGETMTPHFAHATGTVCVNAHESELHLLAKEIISEEKMIMLPHYGNVYAGGLVKFDCVEVEERNDVASLQPDVCGVVRNRKTGKDSRLWIEIKVTHAIGPEKRALIVKNNISCIEVDLSCFIEEQVTKEQLKKFLVSGISSREWTNNPVLERKRQSNLERIRTYAQRKNDEYMNKRLSRMDDYDQMEKLKQEKHAFLKEHKDVCIVKGNNCLKCKHHTTRQAIFEEVQRRHLPTWIKDALSSNLNYWKYEEVNSTVVYDKCYKIQYDTYLSLLPTESPDILGHPVSEREIRQNLAIIPFLQNTVPAIIASEGTKCHHCIHSFRSTTTSYDVACNMTNVVNKHRRK